MAKLFNRAKMTTSTTGSGTVTLGSASVGYQTFADAGVSNGDVVQYVIEEGGNFEIGTGTYSSTGTSLTRSPTESSNSDAAISLGGAATVSITAVADDLNRLQHAGSTKVEPTSTGATVTGNLAVTGTVDGRDVAADGSKLDGIETSADVTDTANVTAAGALMDSEVANLAQVKAFDSSDYATAAQGATADAALARSGGTMTGAITFAAGQTFDGRDVSADGSKLDGIESGATADQTITAGSGLTGGGTGNVTISHADTSTLASVNNYNGTVIQDVYVDGYGHLTGINSVNLDGRYYTESEADSRFVNASGDTMTGDLTIGTDSSRVAINIRSNSWSEIRFWNDGTEQFRLGSSDGTSSYGSMSVGSFYIYDVSSNKMILELPNDGGQLLRQDGTITVFDDNYHPNADKWTTARTLSLSGDASGSVSWDGSANATLSVTVDGGSHNHAYISAGGSGPSTENLNTVADSVSVGQLSYRGFNTSSSNRPPVSDNANGVISVGQHSGGYTAQLAFSSNGNIYWRDNPSTSYGTWRKMWDDGNDGSGSGLDADLLDGYHESTFMRRSANSQLDMNNNDIVGVDQIVHEADSNTYMQFHAADQWRVVVGGSERLEVKNSSPHVLVSGDLNSTSDARLKENVEPIANALSDITQLEGVSFDWKDTGTRGHGFIAQQVEPILPDVVNTDDETGIKSINYVGMIGYLVEAIKELKAEIEELKR